ncbi:MAG TPA: aminotransferase class IV [Polyangiaceae bacterium]|jgi:branched-chain amino acid aminotransferase|nr:aminotransferase class IV [Polyangiaceae bacterium]
MNRIALVNGVTSALDEAKVGVTDRGFLYGDSVFETLRTYAGEPFALDRHLARLARSAALAYIELPVSLEALAGEVRAAIQRAGNAESYVRVMITRGEGELGLDPGLAEGATRVLIVTPLAAPPALVYERGIGAVTFAARRAADGTAAAGAKIGNYLVSVLAMRKARAEGAAEALVVDAAGHVVEGATSNVFFVANGALTTPPDDDGILPGITRAETLEVARALGIAVVFRSPRVEELGAFDEMFISSSIRELVAVVRVDGKLVGNGVPGPMYVRLLAAFRAAVGHR